MANPLEALSASLNKFGEVDLGYMASLLPETEEGDLITEQRIVSLQPDGPLRDCRQVHLG